MAAQSNPFMSVVIPVYNGAVTIGRTLDSLLAQDYPSARYEIIVVNDGSTDDTREVVTTRETVRYIELQRGMGIPTAQNAGLEAAKGDIYVSFNDDFQAAPDFLSQLALAYARLDRPIGIGGILVKDESHKEKGLVAKFIAATRDGAAPDTVNIRPAFLPGAVKRLLVYVISGFSSMRHTGEHRPHDYQKVVELYGANASFRVSTLREIGGWDTNTAAPAIGGIEDRDICYRLQQKFPDHHFYVTRSVRIMQDLDTNDTAISIKRYLLRPYRRGPFNYAFHIKNRLTPPLFPFPPLVLLALLVCAVPAPILLPLLAILLPQLCYGWWPLRAVIERRPVYILFPYLQAAEETMVMIGLLRGLLMHARGKLVINLCIAMFQVSTIHHMSDWQ